MIDEIEPVSRFERVNRSPKRYMQTVREELERWYARFPDPRGDLRARFRSGDTNHDGAFFELFLHELFLRLGMSVEVGPKLDGGSAPDFLVSGASGTAFVEATYLEQPFATPPLEKPVLNTLNELGQEAPAGIGLHVGVVGELKMAPPLKPIRRSVINWLKSLDPQAVNWASGFKHCIAVDIKYGNWRLELEAVPRSSTCSLIVIAPSRMSDRNPEMGLRKAVDKKSHKYTGLQHPLVVAANIRSADLNRAEIAALFGSEALRLRKNSADDELIPEGMVRTGQGLWFDNYQGQIRNSELNGLMMFRDLAPWTVANATACLYLNPYVDDRVPKELRALGHASSTDSELVVHDGERCVRGVFRLDADWPPGIISTKSGACEVTDQ